MKKIKNTSLSIKNINESVELHGWVSKKRNLGGLVFIDLRDRSGIIQLVVNPNSSAYEIAESLNNMEWPNDIKSILMQAYTHLLRGDHDKVSDDLGTLPS